MNSHILLGYFKSKRKPHPSFLFSTSKSIFFRFSSQHTTDVTENDSQKKNWSFKKHTTQQMPTCLPRFLDNSTLSVSHYVQSIILERETKRERQIERESHLITTEDGTTTYTGKEWRKQHKYNFLRNLTFCFCLVQVVPHEHSNIKMIRTDPTEHLYRGGRHSGSPEALWNLHWIWNMHWKSWRFRG